MRIKKITQSTVTQAQILNNKSTSKNSDQKNNTKIPNKKSTFIIFFILIPGRFFFF